jgi:hypothetical protein
MKPGEARCHKARSKTNRSQQFRKNWSSRKPYMEIMHLSIIDVYVCISDLNDLENAPK